ncbi:metal-dependent CAAX amino terminal membrane protease [Streptococcus pneumoniae]|nr:metal-dependent CAAX amino terminal membrane protease [Streptococcus pneumoniae]VPD76253.1 metal-dependent CAAX amino terminal membrane protease [Streptococcus pneumoniae]VPE21852.1 metal-dependent CAAX amino terminal membrane protease [Streptococcus pneumoniae]VPE49061.1 metal-dependent CAAX amino terminal membrane protease [Streptococcus pneumoniae]
MKKYQLLFKISAVFSYLFFVFGLSQMTLIIQNYWQFSSQIGNFVWIQNFLSLLFSGVMIWILVKTGHGLLFSGVMIWILVKTGHGYLFHIPRKKWLWYSILTVLVVVLQISFNVQTAKHVQSTAEGWAVLIGYSGTNFAELGIYITLFFLTPLMEELIYRGLLQHAFFKHSRFGLDLLLPSILFALPHFSSLPSLLDIFIFATSGIIFASLTRYTKSIYPSYAVHVINNIFATLPFLLTFLHRVLG